MNLFCLSFSMLTADRNYLEHYTICFANVHANINSCAVVYCGEMRLLAGAVRMNKNG